MLICDYMEQQPPPDDTKAIIERIEALMREQAELRKLLHEARESELHRTHFRVERRRGERRSVDRRLPPLTQSDGL